MLGRPLGGVAPASSSSRPSTTTTSRCPPPSAATAADARRSHHAPARAPATAGGVPLAGYKELSCSIMALRNASLSAWPMRRPVMKNDTTSTPVGGCRTNHDARALLPAHGSACHHVYASAPAQKSAQSASSVSRPMSGSGAMSRTCARYADRTSWSGSCGTTSGSPSAVGGSPSSSASPPRSATDSSSQARSIRRAVSRPVPSLGWCSATTPTIRPPASTGPPDIPSHGDGSPFGGWLGGGSSR
jgi:hypothetical protein